MHIAPPLWQTSTNMTQPRRLLYLINDLPFFLSHRLPIACAALAAGYEVHVATPDHESKQRIIGAGFHFHPIPMTRKGARLQDEFATLRALWRIYRSVGPHLVHHVTIKPVLYGGLIARLTGVPAVVSAITGLGYVFVARGWKASLRRLAVKWAYRLALDHPRSQVIFQNPDDRAALLAARVVRACATSLIRGSGVDPDQFCPHPEPDGVPVVILAARLIWPKGVQEFIDSARLLKRSGVAARFALVGVSDPENPEAVPTAQLERWHNEKIVEWWGSQDDMPRVFARCHVVCLPSSYGEGIPKVLIEAAACGKAIVTTDTPGCREIVHHEDNGLLVPVRNSDALASAVLRLLQDSELRRQLGVRGRERVIKEFSLDRVVSETLAVYERLLQ